jgi:BirA family biotin operon repressor/biotin-[acetyl-CoA-carboxylase] ligase
LEVFGPLYAAWEARGFDADLRARWLSRSYEIGARMSVKSAGGLIEGAFAGLAENGALLLRDGNGTIRTVSSGELLMDGEHNAAGD